MTVSIDGTTIVRSAVIADVPQIFALLDHYASMGNLLPRKENEIYKRLLEFQVVELDQEIVACGALEIFTYELCEVRSLVVSPQHQSRGYGKILVGKLLEDAKKLGLSRVMALTYRPEFFHQLGFITVNKDSLPEKVWGVCLTCYKFRHCDEIAVLKQLK